MHEIKDTLISEDIFDKKFVCDLASCKGACCIDGDSGAPLSEEECSVLDDVYEHVKPYMVSEGIARIEEEGTYVVDSDGDLVTPLVDNQACAYVFYDEAGITKCSIEKAHLDGKIDFRKPISCSLFPVRLKEYPTFTAVNVQLLEICKCACDLGEQLKVPVYKFLKEPLITRFGSDWYEELEKADHK
tara:strand:- start:3496 stop:4056 length:561 start_codon:yes stop_codon:yes gene_type:complete